MGCRLDFLGYAYASETPDVRPDGFLTTEFGEMEKFTQLAAISNTVNDYWCALSQRPELYCLDIGAPSTLSGSLNQTAYDLHLHTVFSNGHYIRNIYDTANATSVNLFGQVDQCGTGQEKRVGDGMINVFDISTLLAYIFKDYMYVNLNNDPEQVVTVEGRERLVEQCDATTTRQQYLSAYSENTCLHFDTSRRLEASYAASVIETRWRSSPLNATLQQRQPLVLYDQHYRSAVDTPRTSTFVPDVYQVGFAEHTLLPTVDYSDGRWYTLHTRSMALRLHVVFTGIPPQDRTRLELRSFDGQRPLDPSQRQVRFTRLCEYDGSCAARECSIITAPHSGNDAMLHDTLELEQSEVFRACPFDVHVWVPYDQDADRCVGVEYILIGDGARGEYARNTACTRYINDSPPPPLPPVQPPSPIDVTPRFPYLALTAGFLALSSILLFCMCRCEGCLIGPPSRCCDDQKRGFAERIWFAIGVTRYRV